MRNLQEILKPSKGQYDAIAMLSGGKDSVLMVHDLLSTHPDLRVLCITYDDGFLEGHAERNVERVCQHFGLDSLKIRHDCKGALEAYLESDLPRRVDIYIFLEVFQSLFWGKIQTLAASLGGIPVITGNLGYFSSEELLPEQFQQSLSFVRGMGLEVAPVEAPFISYWAEEPFPENLSILKELGWKSLPNLDTEHQRIKDLRERLNTQYPKRTLDEMVEEKWETLTSPRFSPSGRRH